MSSASSVMAMAKTASLKQIIRSRPRRSLPAWVTLAELGAAGLASDDKRQAVEQAIAQLGFVPNPVARGLAGGRTLSVGVVTQAIDSPFYGVALRGRMRSCCGSAPSTPRLPRMAAGRPCIRMRRVVRRQPSAEAIQPGATGPRVRATPASPTPSVSVACIGAGCTA